MGFVFATCEVGRGIEFINKMYPGKSDLVESDIPLLCGLLRRDILRVQDPDFHNPCQIILGNKGDTNRDIHEINAAIEQLMTHEKLR